MTARHEARAVLAFLQKPMVARIFLLIIPLAFYFSFTLPRLQYPGLHSDEAFTALPALRLVNGRKTPEMAYFTFRSTDFPLAMAHYHGAFESYLVAPFIYAMGSTAQALRLPMILIGALTLIFFFGLLQLLTRSSALAWLGTMLLALHPTYVVGTRIGMYYGAFQPFCVVTSLLCFLAWREGRKSGYLYATFFILGAGAASRSWFAAHVAALAVSGFFPLSLPNGSPDVSAANTRWRTIAIALIFFFTPCLPFVISLFQNWDRDSIAEMIRHSSIGANHSYINGIAERLGQFKEILVRNDFLAEIYPGHDFRYRFYGPLLLIAPFWCALTLPLSRFQSTRKEKAFFLTYSVAFLAVSPLSPSDLKNLHLFEFLPIAVILVVLAMKDFSGALSSRVRWAPVASMAAFGILVDPPGVQALIKRGENEAPYYSDAIYGLSTWLRENRHFDGVEVLRGSTQHFTYLTGAQIAIESLGDQESAIARALADPRTLYVDYLDEAIGARESRRAPELLRYEITRLHRKIQVLREFSGRDGRPIFVAFQVPPRS